MSEALGASPLAQAVGLALLHFLWQGLVIGATTAVLLMACRRAAPQVRYLIACLGLAVMVAAPVVTGVGHWRETTIGRPTAGLKSGATAEAMPVVVLRSQAPTSVDQAPLLSAERLEPYLPLVVVLWFSGVLVFASHLLGSWLRVKRFARRATPLAAPWAETVRVIAGRLGIARRLRLVESALVDVPAVIGALRPVIIIPTSALAGLPPAELEAILAHELAHVRRGDYLVNVVQSIVEVLLFYHPAVWWVSRQIRLEREHCCDDVAASLSGDRIAYARALASLEELRQAPALAMGAGGGELLHRVRRLVDPRTTTGPGVSGGFAMGIVLTVLLLAVGNHISGQTTVDDQSATPPPAPATVATVTAASVSSALDTVATLTGPQVTGQQSTTVRVASTIGPGKVSGTVRDQDGGVIPGATVTIIQSEGSDARNAITNARGQFVIPDVPAGRHNLSVTLSGFKKYQATLQVTSGQELTTLTVLEIGSLTETVTVRAGDVTGPPATQAVPQVQAPPSSRAAEYLDLAKQYYEQGRLNEAEAMMVQALAFLRASRPPEVPVTTTSVPVAATDVPVNPNAAVPIRVGGSIQEPKKIRDVKPIYPPEAAAAGAFGVVILEAVVGKDGTVRDVKVLRSVPMLDEAAMGAVRQWMYTPTLLNKRPVDVLMTVSVNFLR